MNSFIVFAQFLSYCSHGLKQKLKTINTHTLDGCKIHNNNEFGIEFHLACITKTCLLLNFEKEKKKKTAFKLFRKQMLFIQNVVHINTPF